VPLPAAFAGLALSMVIGATSTLNPNEAAQIYEEFRSFVVGLTASPLGIFQNNFMIALLMSIPVAGAFLGAGIMYNSGVILSAASIAQRVDPMMLVLSTLIWPVGIMEMLAYSLASTQSLLLAYAGYKRMLRSEARNLAVTVAVVAVLLAASSVIEFTLLNAIGP